MSAADAKNAGLTTRVDLGATRLAHIQGDSTEWSGGGSPAPLPVSGAARRRDDEQPSVILWPGMRVEQYELIAEIGRGGMGQVFLARDTKLGRRVALKFLNLRDQRLVERFIVEARATAQCHHENIVVIYEAGEAESPRITSDAPP